MFSRFFNRKMASEEPHPVMEGHIATKGMQSQEPDAAGMISMIRQFMALLREDMGIADGYIDTGKAQDWVNEADDLLTRAEDALANRRYNRAAAFADAARTLVEAADMLVAQTLGINSLRQGRQRPQHDWLPQPVKHNEPLSDEQVRRELAQTHEHIVAAGSLPVLEASDKYLMQALNAYKTAYDAYRDGNHQAASDACRMAQVLLRVAGEIRRAIDT